MQLQSLFVAIAAIVISTTSVLACACCAEHGQRMQYRAPLDDYIKSELATLRAWGGALVYTDACGLECVEGISAPEDAYSARFSASDSQISLDLGVGVLSLSLPEHYEIFATDTAPHSYPTTVALYTELRISGSLEADGGLAAVSGAEADLVFFGPGNACLQLGQMHYWSLDVRGDGVNFRLYGRLAERE